VISKKTPPETGAGAPRRRVGEAMLGVMEIGLDPKGKLGDLANTHVEVDGAALLCAGADGVGSVLGTGLKVDGGVVA
jgi:hypothetical protein